jgi:hypothetical protein
MIKESTMRTFIAALACLAVTGLAAPAARADFDITKFGGSVGLGGAGSAGFGTAFSRQAGGHADLTTMLRFSDGEDVRTVKVDLPPGFVGNPTAAPTCTRAELVGAARGKNAACPLTSQVGIVGIYGNYANSVLGNELPVYNMEQPADLPALFAFNRVGVVVYIEPRLRSSDYGISATVPLISSQTQGVPGTVLTLWGVPADSSHNPDRWWGEGDIFDSGRGGPRAESPAPRLPFLSNPTSCPSAPSAFTAQADSWQSIGVFSGAAFDSDLDGTPFQWAGCEKLAFDPSIKVAPGSHLADAPAGLTVDVSVPQSDAPDGLATAHVRKTSVRLPTGMTVSPSSAAGLGACALSEIALGSDREPTCPDSAKIGTVSIDTPLLADPLEGDVILAKQDDNPFHSLLALYLVVRGPGVLIKLPGRVDLDPVTGQLTSTFDNTPQLPFSHLRVAFRGGPKAPLATPTACGTYTTHTEITSWASDTPVKLETPMVIDQGCERRELSPSFSAGTSNPVAGADASFRFSVTRADRTANLSRIDAVLPPGLLANIAGVPQCAEEQAAAGTCGAGSQIGSTFALSGPGETPLPVRGRVYLTGPYKGAPFGLSIVVPTAGQAGPFDLGDIVVRAGISVDRTDAHVTVTSDPLPTIIQGIPLRLRQVVVDIDREGFMFNPTSCDAKSIFGGFTSTDGPALTREVPFRLAGCRELPVNQTLALALKGKKSTTDGTHPGLQAKLTSPAGAANLKTARVALPLSLALDPDNAQALCKPEQRAALACPAASIVGRAVARSVLPNPLTGPVYFVEGLRKSATGRTIRTLPKLWIPLSGDGVTIDVNADSEIRQDRLVTTFREIPDAPISSFDLTINGGKHGILVVSGKPGTCDRSKMVDREFIGQNGVTARAASEMSVEGCKPTVTHKKSTSRSLTVQVTNVGAGRLTVRGSSVIRATRTLKASSRALVTLTWTSAARRALLRHRSVRVKLATTFRPKTGAAVKATKSMTVRLKRSKST